MGQKITVLFVEDDAAIREVIPSILPEGEFTVLVADSGYAALRILGCRHVDVLFTDIVMPEFDGVELAKEALEMCPNLRVLFMTGYLAPDDEAEQIAPLFYKPIRVREIEYAIRTVLAEPPDRIN
jgi:two-component system cell cycle response regulator CpdR